MLAAVGATYGKTYLHEVTGRDACFAGYLVRFRPNHELDSEFFSYWTQGDSYWSQLHSGVIQSTIQNFSASRYKGLSLALPPLPEQRFIVRYLNYVDRRIRRYVRTKERLIGLLEEEQQAIINQAVTRGLDPSVRLKSSGVEWLGDVPEHWEVRRLKTLCDRSGQYGANVASVNYQEHGVRFLRTTDIAEDGSLRSDGVYTPESLVPDHILSDGDILVSRSGTVGRSFHYKERRHGRCSFAGYLVRFSPSRDLLSRYLFLFTKTAAFDAFLGTASISSTIENVNAEKYANTDLPLPPIDEQTAIVDHLGKIVADSAADIAHVRRQVELVQEYRTRLIADVVTGKLDVREAAAGLPDEGDDEDAMAEGVFRASSMDEGLHDSNGLA